MRERKNRSDRYQYILVESSCSPEMMCEFAESDSIRSRLDPWGYNEELLDLKDQLRIEFWRLVETKLTNRQREVIRLYADGLTQIEIAKKLNVNQSSITKSINGNCDYRNGKRIYGGAKKKLGKLIELDPKIQEILSKIANIQEDNLY